MTDAQAQEALCAEPLVEPCFNLSDPGALSHVPQSSCSLEITQEMTFQILFFLFCFRTW